MTANVHQQVHGYQDGHELLESTVRLGVEDQDVVDHLSDLAGPLRPGESFKPYVTAYPLPSGKYYAMARTEQDTDAPRAGCVMTKTLLVPIDFWAAGASPRSIAALLEKPFKHSAIHVPYPTRVHTLHELSDPVLSELVEAMFLETRRPIVVFGSIQAYEIALRLLTAFWPAMRRSFSVCTFVLSPRTLAGRSFDLVFAPGPVRARFSEWEGRRVDGVRHDGIERHRWTSVLTDRIFASADPHLADPDTLEVLIDPGNMRNEALVRLALRWEELWKKAAISPTAVLGLIDIANSSVAKDREWELLEPVVVQCIGTAALSLELDHAWEFLNTLLKKLESKPYTEVIGQAIRSAAAKLTQQDWQEALNWIRDELTTESRHKTEFYGAVASELAKNASSQLTRALASIPPDRLLQIALLKESLLDRLFSCTDPHGDAALIQNITKGVSILSVEARRTNMGRLLQRIRRDEHSELLAQILVDATGPELVAAVESVWGLSGCRTKAIGDILCAAAKANDRSEVRSAFALIGTDSETNHCIEQLLMLESEDVSWLLTSTDIAHQRLTLLRRLVERASTKALETAFRRRELVRGALELLLEDITRSAQAAARLVILRGISMEEHVNIGLKILPHASGTTRVELAQSMVHYVIDDATLQAENLPERVMAAVVKDIDFSIFKRAGLGLKCDGGQVGKTLVLLKRTRVVLGGLVERHTKDIVWLVAKRGRFDLQTDGARALASLIAETKGRDRRTHVEICSIALPFAMASRRKPASQIVMVTFPVVYDELRNGRGDFRLEYFFDFLDWDRCKVARKALVRAFILSDWPPVDLGVTAFRACELERILKRVQKTPGARSYLRQIEEGVKLLEDESRWRILGAIRRVRGETEK